MVMLPQSLKKCVSHKFVGATMTLDIRKHPSSVAVKPKNVLAAGIADLKYDCQHSVVYQTT